MAQPQYAARFENFFANLRFNRTQFVDRASFTLQALHEDKYKALVNPLEVALTDYRAIHVGQLSGEGQVATSTLAQGLSDFKAYVKKTERKVIIPAYDEGSSDMLAIFSQRPRGPQKSIQTHVIDAFTAFLDALNTRPTVFTSPVRTEGRAVLTILTAVLQRADGLAKNADSQRLDLHDGREATCLALFQVYATFLKEFVEKPARVAAFSI